MLSWSAETIGRELDLARLITDGDIGLSGAVELVLLGRASTGIEANAAATEAVAAVLGEEAAVGAAAVAAAFELLNRAVDATGLPVGRASKRRMAPVIAALEMARFPHAHLTDD